MGKGLAAGVITKGRAVFLLCLWTVFLVGAGCQSKRISRIFLITFDAARWDFLPRACGNTVGRPTSMPHLAKFCQQSVVFTRAYSPFPTTTIAFASLYTGTHPLHHRIIPRYPILSPAYLTLAEQLRSHRYTTYLATGNVVINDVNLYTQGFVFYDLGSVQTKTLSQVSLDNPDAMVAHVIKRLPTICKRRCFAHIHFAPPHSPYGAPARFFEDYPGQDYSSISTEVVLDLNRRHVAADRLPRPVYRRILAHYRARLRWADDALGRLLHFLELQGWLDSSVIIFTSDHGEAFGEHRSWTHNSTVYEEMTHIPMVIYRPDGEPRFMHNLVNLEDLYPTLLQFVNSRADWYLPFGSVPIPVAPTDPKLPRQYSILTAASPLVGPVGVVYRDYKYIYYRSLNLAELYNLRRDPYEKVNRILTDYAIARRLHALIPQFTNYLQPPTTMPPMSLLASPDARSFEQELERLGYVGVRYLPVTAEFDLKPAPIDPVDVDADLSVIERSRVGPNTLRLRLRLINRGRAAWPYRALPSGGQVYFQCRASRDFADRQRQELKKDVYPGQAVTFEFTINTGHRSPSNLRCELKQAPDRVLQHFNVSLNP